MKVIATRNFAYGFGMVLTGEVLDLGDIQATMLIDQGLAVQEPTNTPEPGFKDMQTKETKKGKKK